MLELRDVAVRIGEAAPLGGVSFGVEPGEMLGIVGESGSGKSLTLRAILRLLPVGAVMGGQVLWRGRDLAGLTEGEMRAIRGREIAMIFQEPSTALNPVLPVGLQITESLAAHSGVRGDAARRRAVALLDQVGIPGAASRLGSYPHEFSGGMRQRAMIAIALAPGPRLLLADEPTTALDVTIQDQILKLLLRLKDELGMAVILVTHDLAVVAGTCDRVAVFYAGRVMETGSAAAIFGRPSHGYTVGLLRSIPGGVGPGAGGVRERLRVIGGAPPDPRAMPPGCRFAPRCAFAIEGCVAGDPALVELEAGHASACIRAGAVREAAVQEGAGV